MRVEDQGVADDVRLAVLGAVGHLEQAAVAGPAAVLGDRLGDDRGGGVRRLVDDLAAGVLVLTLAGEGDREDLAAGARALHVDGRVLHGEPRAEVAVDPLHDGVIVGQARLVTRL